MFFTDFLDDDDNSSFHTIKSILNQLYNNHKCVFPLRFHTIKSILNQKKCGS